MGSALAQREHQPRSPRIQSPIGRDSSFVRYMGPGLGAGIDYKTAVLADVSHSGARLISRMPTRAKIGDFISLEFSLPGSDHKIKSQARVVRKINDFVFAVRFIGVTKDLQGVIDDSINDFNHYRRFPSTGVLRRAQRWFSEHKQGLAVSFVAMALAFGLGLYFYVHSDEYAGRQLRPWGQEVPRDWYWDYVNKFNK